MVFYAQSAERQRHREIERGRELTREGGREKVPIKQSGVIVWLSQGA